MCTTTCICYVLVLYAIWCGSGIAERFKNEVIAVNDCDIRQEDFEPNPIKHIEELVTVNKKKSLQQNYTVEQKTLPVFTTISGYRIGKRKILEYEVANLTCANRVVSVIWKRLGLRFDKKCCLLKDARSVTNVSTNFDDLFMKLRAASLLQVGQRQYDMKLHTKRGVLMCLSVTLNVTKY